MIMEQLQIFLQNHQSLCNALYASLHHMPLNQVSFQVAEVQEQLITAAEALQDLDNILSPHAGQVLRWCSNVVLCVVHTSLFITNSVFSPT